MFPVVDLAAYLIVMLVLGSGIGLALQFRRVRRIRRALHATGVLAHAEDGIVTILAALRLAGPAHPRGGWRDGRATVVGSQITWQPRRGRPAVVVTGPEILRMRGKSLREFWSLHPNLVVMPCVSEHDAYEIGVFPETLAFLTSSVLPSGGPPTGEVQLISLVARRTSSA